MAVATDCPECVTHTVGLSGPSDSNPVKGMGQRAWIASSGAGRTASRATSGEIPSLDALARAAITADKCRLQRWPSGPDLSIRLMAANVRASGISLMPGRSNTRSRLCGGWGIPLRCGARAGALLATVGIPTGIGTGGITTCTGAAVTTRPVGFPTGLAGTRRAIRVAINRCAGAEKEQNAPMNEVTLVISSAEICRWVGAWGARTFVRARPGRAATATNVAAAASVGPTIVGSDAFGSTRTPGIPDVPVPRFALDGAEFCTIDEPF